jgi:hypothetical protein
MKKLVKKIGKRNATIVIVALVVAIISLTLYVIVWQQTHKDETEGETGDETISLFKRLTDQIIEREPEKPKLAPSIERAKEFLQVYKTVPKNNAVKIAEHVEHIEITFKVRPEPHVREFIKFEIEPAVAFDIEWTEYLAVRLNIKENLARNTKYTVKTYYEIEMLHSFSFITNLVDETTYRTEVAKQIALDIEFALGQEGMLEQYPFQPKMPVVTDLYVVVYDFALGKFRIRIRMPETAPEYDKSNALDSALAHLEGLEIAPEEFGGYYILYTEENEIMPWKEY